jgi:hypothetical protein
VATETLDALINLDTRVNKALDTIETDLSEGLTSEEATELNTAMTATAVRSEEIAGTTPPPAPGRKK